MTNFPPEPPQSSQPPSQPRRPVVSFDEFVAIIVAFSTIGAILFWTLGDQVQQIIPGDLMPQDTNLPNIPGISPQPDNLPQPGSTETQQ